MTRKLSRRAAARKHVHNRILFQLVVFAIISVVFFSIVTVDMFHESMNPLLVVGSIAVGLLVGVLAGRIFSLKWHEDTQKVILGMDKLGFLLIIAYIGFRILSEKFFGSFLHGDELTIVTFSTLGGIMVGRLFSLLRGIQNVLRKQGIL